MDRRWLIVFGGSTGVKLLSCTWEFDLEKERWRKVHYAGTIVPSGTKFLPGPCEMVFVCYIAARSCLAIHV